MKEMTKKAAKEHFLAALLQIFQKPHTPCLSERNRLSKKAKKYGNV